MKIFRSGLILAAALFAITAQAQVKISDLPAAGALAGTEAVPAVQTATTVKTTPAAINTYVQGQTTSSTIVGKFSGTCNATTALTGDGSCQAFSPEVSGTFTATYSTGFTTSPTQTFSYTKTGSLVVLRATATVTGTSNAVTFTTAAGDLPAAIRPVNNTLAFPGFTAVNNGAATTACLTLLTDGTIRYSVRSVTDTQCGGAWTGSGTKTISAANSSFLSNVVYSVAN